VGRSGSGKTTGTRLLQRLHSNYEGLIKIDGVDVREYDVDHLRRSLGVVLQENFSADPFAKISPPQNPTRRSTM
jgi:ATP-binding cassette, subfamily B, bacterial HlyB/CyaB